MPDDRFFHKRAGHSEKVNQLTDFEELVWRYYILSSDDFGVMRFTPAQIQADHERMGLKPARLVQRALDRVVGVGLVHPFEHQGRVYCYSRNWQRFQKIGYPRETAQPCPPPREIEACEESTRLLFLLHPGGTKKRVKKPEDSGNGSGVIPERFSDDFPHARARALAHALANTNGSENNGSGAADSMSVRAGRFVESYRELHQRYVGVPYMGNPVKDYEAACRLVESFDDATLPKLATIWLNADDDFATNGTRTITKFLSRASDYAKRLKSAVHQ